MPCKALSEFESHNMQTTFRCWICGEDVDSIFSITVLKTANVNALKDAIKAFRSHRFRDVTASDLKLYSFPSHDDPELAIQRWTPGDGKELSSTKKLTKVASKHLIVVEGPGARLLRYSVALLMSASLPRFTCNWALCRHHRHNPQLLGAWAVDGLLSREDFNHGDRWSPQESHKE